MNGFISNLHRFCFPLSVRVRASVESVVWRAFAVGLVVSFASTSIASEEPIETKGELDAVTVYRGQAMVTRVVELGDLKGMQHVVVEALPAEVVGDSIYAESTGDLIVRSVRYRTRPVREDVREQVRKLDSEIDTLERRIREVESKREVLGEQETLVNRLEDFTVPSADWDLSHGVLNSEVLQTISEFLFQQHKRIGQERLSLQFEKEDLEDQLEQVRREREQLTASSSKTEHEAVVWVEANETGSAFELRYLVENATWSPSYNLRGPASRDSVNLEYLASIRQTSGEDWNDVKMTLSTASPSLVSEPPELASLSLSLREPRPADQPQQAAGRAAQAYDQQRSELRKQQAAIQRQRSKGTVTSERFQERGAGGGMVAPGQGEESSGLDMQLNRLGAQQQLLDIRAGRGEADGRERRARDDQQASVRYELPGRTSLPSRADQQLVRITDRELEAKFFRVARPVLSEHVYEQAELSNTLDWVLLSGPANSYLDGQFVGRGRVPSVSVGEAFTVGFGIDSSLRGARDLLDRNEITQGGNRVVRVTYRLSVANFSSEERAVRLFDRLPVPKRGEDVQVELVETSMKPDKSPADESGQITPGSDGIIRWDVAVPGGATGDDQLQVDYTFTMELARQKEINLSTE